jgi:23S rRNA pseudouridine1911/1915/1917 synthase
MENIIEVRVKDFSGRLDTYLASLKEADLYSRSQVQSLIRQKQVLVNGKIAEKTSLKIQPGDNILVKIPLPADPLPQPEAIQLDILYEDDQLLVLNKPRGMVVHPAPGNPRGTLVNALLAHCRDLSGIGGEKRPGIVHRLDKDTSGLLVVAKTARAHLSLASQLKSRSMTRAYLAFIHGIPPTDTGKIDAPIGRDKVNRLKMAVDPANGRQAETYFQVLEKYKGFSMVKCKLITGRTHQIRVHLSYIGHPLVGDTRYGAGRNTPFSLGQALHAFELTLVHPVSLDRLHFQASLPKELLELQQRLKLLTE